MERAVTFSLDDARKHINTEEIKDAGCASSEHRPSVLHYDVICTFVKHYGNINANIAPYFRHCPD